MSTKLTSENISVEGKTFRVRHNSIRATIDLSKICSLAFTPDFVADPDLSPVGRLSDDEDKEPEVITVLISISLSSGGYLDLVLPADVAGFVYDELDEAWTTYDKKQAATFDPIVPF